MIRSLLKSVIFIHLLALLAMLALWGYLKTGGIYLAMALLLSILGAICGASIRIIEATNSTQPKTGKDMN